MSDTATMPSRMVLRLNQAERESDFLTEVVHDRLLIASSVVVADLTCAVRDMIGESPIHSPE